MSESLNIVILGLSITSSWGNGHATTYRALVHGLSARGHTVLFLERNQPWYAKNRDLPDPPYGRTCLYADLDELKDRFTDEVAHADLVIVGSYVPDGVEVGQWVIDTTHGVTAFYDIDTPITLAKLVHGDFEYLHPDLIPRYGLYLSFTGGPLLSWLKRSYRAQRVEPLYCSVDPDLHSSDFGAIEYDLGYMGTYSEDRQPSVQELLLSPAIQWESGRFAIVGPQYPETIAWPSNVHRIEHLPPAAHRRFYTSQRFTLNVTRRDMIRAGYSPSVRLFEAAACGTPVISDYWLGLNSFFKIGEEILVAERAEDVLRYLQETSDAERLRIGERARAKVLSAHTSIHRAIELENHVRRTRGGFPRPRIIHGYG